MKTGFISQIRSYLLITMALILGSVSAWAVPVLQVDINGGMWMGENPNPALNDSTVIEQQTFVVDAIYTYKNRNSPDPAGLYYLVVGITDLNGNAVSSFETSLNIDGVDYVDSDFTVSNVPISDSPYGPYPTLNIPISFSFDTATSITTYDLEVQPGDPVLNPTGGSLLVTFDVDRTNLSNDYLVVFDLVAYDGTMAPPSHNGVSLPGGPNEPEDPIIPEPATMALVALGLGGLATRRSWRKKV